jgi:Predicted transcription regulator containing HTH domain
MDIRPIRTDQDHIVALGEIDTLWNAPEGSDDAARLDLLITLVDNYEATRWPIDDPDRDPVDVLHYAIGDMGHSQSELAEIIGSRSRASEVLARRRALTVAMIHRISETWKIPAGLLVRPYALRRAVKRRAARTPPRKAVRAPKSLRAKKLGRRRTRIASPPSPS